MSKVRKRIDSVHRGFYSDHSKTKCYRVWALGAAVLVDADDDEEARRRGRRLLDVSDADIDTVECLD